MTNQSEILISISEVEVCHFRPLWDSVNTGCYKDVTVKSSFPVLNPVWGTEKL